MPFNGSGTFVRLRSWINDAAAGILIRADYHDSEDDNFAQGLSQCITKDGQTTVTANLPMASYLHTNVGNATARNHYAAYGQVQDGKINWAESGGTADAITASYNPSTAAPVDGQIYYVRAGFANATTTPTFAPDGYTARTIVKNGNVALVAGDIGGDGHELILRYRLSDTKYELLNPAITTATIGAQPLDAELTAIAGLASAANKIPMFSGSETATMIDFKDEDNMASDSNTAVPSQQSVKAYVDANASVLQRQVVQTGTYDNSTTVIPLDNTIPQITEGKQILTSSFTPLSTTSTIEVEVIFQGVDGAGGARFVAAMFKDSGANAINAAFTYPNGGIGGAGLTLNHDEVSGSLTARTYSVRYGPDTAGTAYVNGQSTGARFGGTCITKMIITEWAS